MYSTKPMCILLVDVGELCLLRDKPDRNSSLKDIGSHLLLKRSGSVSQSFECFVAEYTAVQRAEQAKQQSIFLTQGKSGFA